MGKPFHHQIVFSNTRWLRFNAASSNRLHSHAYFEACIVISGHGEFTHGETTYFLSPGDLFISDPNEHHEIRTQNGLELFFLCFHVASRRIGRADKAEPALCLKNVPAFLIRHRNFIAGQAHLIPLFEHLMKLAQHENDVSAHPFYRDGNRLLLDQIFAVSLEESAAEKNKLKNEQDASYTRVVQWIEANLDQPIKIAHMAEDLGVSERSLRRKWANLSPLPLMKEINRRRIIRASQLLLLADLSVAEVGAHVGIPDPACFSRLFKSYRGSSPRQFRSFYQDRAFADREFLPPFATDYIDRHGTAETKREHQPPVFLRSAFSANSRLIG